MDFLYRHDALVIGYDNEVNELIVWNYNHMEVTIFASDGSMTVSEIEEE